MEERSYHPLPEIQEVTTILSAPHTLSAGVARSVRDVQPADYTLQIKSFSIISNVFSQRAVEMYESASFESGGYKWRLSLYPNGDQKRDGNGHISLYLQLVKPETLPVGFEVFVNFKLFIHDQIRDRYLTIQDADGRLSRFHKTKPKHGFPRLISLDVFNDASNGYLVDDSCVFGAEVFVLKNKGKVECLSMMMAPTRCDYLHCFDNFSKLENKEYKSPPFTAGRRKWRLAFYPGGHKDWQNGFISLYLELADCERSHNKKYLGWFRGEDSTTIPQEWKVYIECTLYVKDQVHGRNMERKLNHWFSAASPALGYQEFMKLSDLKDCKKGFLRNDSLIIGATFVLFAAQDFS